MPPPKIAAMAALGQLPDSMRERLLAARELEAKSLLQTAFSIEWLKSQGAETPEQQMALALRYVPTVLCGTDWWTDPSTPSPAGKLSPP